MVQWKTPEDPSRYYDSIQAKDMAFDRSQSKKKHAKKVIEYEKFLGAEESLRTFNIRPPGSGRTVCGGPQGRIYWI